MKIRNVFVHDSTYLDQPVQIGVGTKIWHFCHIMKNSSIGEDCILGQNVHVAEGVIIGNHVRIQNNVSIFNGVELEDYVFCGPSSVFTNVINPRSEISRKDEYKRTLVKRGASIGANATIICGVEIGRYAFVGAGAVLSHDIPDYALVTGVPARQIGWFSRHGYRLRQVSESIYICPISNWRYELFAPNSMKCIDWPEDRALASSECASQPKQ